MIIDQTYRRCHPLGEKGFGSCRATRAAFSITHWAEGALVVVFATFAPAMSSATTVRYYSACVRTIDVAGERGVFDPADNPTYHYLYLVAANVQDDGENEANFTSPTGDIGLHILGGQQYELPLNEVRMFGPYEEGTDDDGTHKLEWLSYCTAFYNHFAVMQLTGYQWTKVHIQAIEGDDLPGNPDDVVFDAYVDVTGLSSEPTPIQGQCDIPGKCATLWLASRSASDYDDPGHFWDMPGPFALRPIPTSGVPRPVRGLAEGIFYLGAEAKNLGEWFYNLPNRFSHNWAAIVYADGYCIFNRFRSNRTTADVVDHARGRGDCDWWEWPEEANRHVCLNSYPAALRLAHAHGGVAEIRWIDHPTANCGW